MDLSDGERPARNFSGQEPELIGGWRGVGHGSTLAQDLNRG
jgi:hypothetical protein